MGALFIKWQVGITITQFFKVITIEIDPEILGRPKLISFGVSELLILFTKSMWLNLPNQI